MWLKRGVVILSKQAFLVLRATTLLFGILSPLNALGNSVRQGGGYWRK